MMYEGRPANPIEPLSGYLPQLLDSVDTITEHLLQLLDNVDTVQDTYCTIVAGQCGHYYRALRQ
jgi:hypothetical protein